MFGPKIKAYQDLLLNLKESEIEETFDRNDITIKLHPVLEAYMLIMMNIQKMWDWCSF